MECQGRFLPSICVAPNEIFLFDCLLFEPFGDAREMPTERISLIRPSKFDISMEKSRL
jgi:hypothetical protein